MRSCKIANLRMTSDPGDIGRVCEPVLGVDNKGALDGRRGFEKVSSSSVDDTLSMDPET